MRVILKTADDDNVDVETDRAEEHGERWCLGAHTPATTERLRVGARAFYHLTVTFDAGPPAGERERQLLKAFGKVSSEKSLAALSSPFCSQKVVALGF